MHKFTSRLVRFLCIVSLLAVGVVGCSTNKTDRENNEIWKSAKEGKLPGVDIAIGTSKKEAIQKFGAPLKAGHSEFSYRLEYENFWLDYRANGVLESLEQLPDDAVLEAITVKPDFVKWTGTTQEVNSQFGKPNQEFDDEAYGPAWNQVYDVTDKLALYFIAEAKGEEIFRIRLQSK